MLQFRIVPVTPFEQNCTLMWCDETMEGAVVDPGGDLEIIMGAVRKFGVKLSKILVTHGHIDHVGGVGELARTLSLPIEGPQQEDAFWIDQLPEQSKRFGFAAAESFTPTRWLADGDTVTVGKATLEVLHTPGHTPGHVVFYYPEGKVAIVGDVLFAGSIGRTDFPRGDHATLIHSIRDKLWPLGDDVSFIPGHGPTSTFGRERQSNPFVGDRV